MAEVNKTIMLLISNSSGEVIYKERIALDNGYLLWLEDSMDVVQEGINLTLKLKNDSELKQIQQFFPLYLENTHTKNLIRKL